MALIASVAPGSPAERAGIVPGLDLISINSHAIEDILDYRFFSTDKRLKLLLSDGKKTFTVKIKNPDYEPLGLDFENPLICKETSCRNKCVFCFIDQLPKGMRQSLYFKDDDLRLSFLTGSYITLTNLDERQIRRICDLRISPINVSVHATDPEVRCSMLSNRFAGSCLDTLKTFAAHGITVNCQIVVCPDINDGEVLRRSLTDLCALWPQVASVAVVPVGLTDHREGLPPLRAVEKQDAREILSIISEFADHNLYLHGSRIVYGSDEFYLTAELPLPSEEEYEGYPQIENGVGLLTSLRTEFVDALEELDPESVAPFEFSVATGVSAAGLMRELVDLLEKKCHNIQGRVYVIENRFFGKRITVAGLITGKDLTEQLSGRDLGSRLLISASMLRYDGEVFLDDMTPAQAEKLLSTDILPVKNDGYALLRAMTNKEEGNV